jgi:polysaccharide pyruvyl transferase WcaK-like protein
MVAGSIMSKSLTGADRPMANDRLLLYGYFGGRNFGDELMLLGLLSDAAEAGFSSVAIVTPDGQVPSHLTKRVATAFPRTVVGILKGMWWAGSFAICGGTMFHDGYPSKRHRKYRLNLVALAGLCLLARSFGLNVILAGVGLGPFRRQLTILMTKIALMSATRVIVRDNQSYREALSLKIGPPRLIESQDLSVNSGIRLEFREQVRPYISISVVSPDLTSITSSADVQEFHERLAAEVAAYLRSNDTIDVRILIVGVGRNDSDEFISLAFADLFSGELRERISIVYFDGDPILFSQIIGNSKAVLATRYHVAVAAHLLGVPCFWIAYHRKLIDTANAFGVPSDSVEVPRGATAKQIGKWFSDFAKTDTAHA